jgi:hypothetical protein
LTVEVGVDGLGQTETGAAVMDLDAIHLEGIKVPLHFQGAQAQVHFVELIAQPHGAVAADGALDPMVEELVEVEVRV